MNGLAVRYASGSTGAGTGVRAFGRFLVIAVVLLQAFATSVAFAQDRVLTALVMINSQNAAGYNTSPSNPGEYQRFAERYFEHLQIPYETIDVSAQSPPTLTSRQLIVAGHSGLNLSTAWRNAIATAVQGGVGFVNLDSDGSVGLQSHIQTLFGATGSSAGTPGTAITVPQAVQVGGASQHFIANLQQRFANDPAGDIVYGFHPDGSGVTQTVASTVLTGATGTVIARIGSDPLIVATTSGSGRAVHFGTLNYLRADRFGFLMGADDLFWRSLVWAARKPFVVRGYPRLWSVQMDDTLPGWGDRVRDMYNPTYTGTPAADGTGGPWRVTGYVFTDNLPPGSAERAAVINDINAGTLQVSPHARGPSLGNLFWESPGGAPLTTTTWLATIQDIDNWLIGNGGADEIPFISRSLVPHFWNLSNITGSDLWNALGFRYITEIQRAGVEFFSKTNADRLPLRPYRTFELPPTLSPDETYPVYWADNYVVNSHSGLPAQTFFGFTTQVINLDRYDRQDAAWPNSTRPVDESIDQLQYYTWRLWSSLAPSQIYTHDGGGGGGNYVLSTPTERQQVIQTVSGWLNQRGARHVFMEEVGAYMSARTRSTLTTANTVGSNLMLNFSGNAGTATEVLYFSGNAEGIPVSVSSFTSGASASVPTAGIVGNPAPTTTSLSPSTTAASGAAFTLTVNGTGFIPASIVRWNNESRATTYVSATQVRAQISAADIASVGTSSVTVYNGGPGGGISNSQTFTMTGNASPAITSLAPSTASVGGAAFTLTVNGTGFINGSVVRWNGANRTTTFVSSTQLTAAITAADISVGGTAGVTVFTPSPGGGTSAAQTFQIVGPSGTFFDDFNRADNAAIGNNWVEKNAAAFAIASNRVTKAATGQGFADNLLYRPSSEVMLDGEASVEVRFASVPPGYAQLFVRGQTSTIATAGTFTGYLLFIDNNSGQAFLDRIENGAFAQLAAIALNPVLNTTDTYRLRLRALGTNPVAVSAFVERFTGSSWAVIGQAVVNDTAATRIATAGTVGFTGYVEGGIYSYDNFTRTSFDGNNPVPATTGIAPSTGSAGGAAFTLTVNGSNFVPGSTVRWNGSSRTTTFLSATQVTAAITAADLAAAGSASVTVLNPTPGGGTSNAQTFTIGVASNPAPVLSTMSPSSALVGGSAFTLTLDGSGFVNGSVVRWNGSNRTTTFVSSTQLTAAIPATDLAAGGIANVTVFSPTPGGGTSAAQSFLVGTAASFFDDFNRANNEFLSLGWVEKTPGAFAITSNRVTKVSTATGYADNLVYRPSNEVMLDGEASVEMRFATMPPGYAQVFVRGQMSNIAQPGQLTGYLLFTDNNASLAYVDRMQNGNFVELAPIAISPALNTTDTYRLRLRATGTNPVVVSAFVERWDGSTWAISGQAVVNDTAATRVATAGTSGFTGDFNEGGVYSYDNFTRTSFDGNNPVPTTTTLSPSSATAGGAAFTLTVNGTNFVPASQVRWNGTSRTTTYVSATQIRAAISASDIASASTASVTVFNPTPGGGLSNGQNFTISAGGGSNPLPTLSTLAPASATSGGAAFTLTATGTGFVNGSIVRWNGSNRTTTFVSSTQLTATITASDIATASSANVTVFSPTPGGGTSAAQSFFIGSAASFFDDFNRTDNASLGLAWVEKTPSAFAIASSRVTKAATAGGFADNLVYRPSNEVMLDGEASVEVRFASVPPGYAQVFVRGQMSNIATAGQFTGYLLFVDNSTSQAYVDRVENGAFTMLGSIPLNPVLNTTDTYRLRLRATGTNPVVVSAYVERWNGSSWSAIGQAVVNDAAATRVATSGTVGFTAFTEGGVYTYDNFTRASFDGPNPAPTTTSVSPTSATAGGAAFTLTVNGTNFVPGSEVRWNGTSRTTTYLSATQLTAAIAASDIASSGTASVTVFNPTPGGGLSNGQNFTIGAGGNPVPALSTLSPASATTGGPGFTLTVTGGGFISGSIVRWNGANRTTTFVSSTQLTAAIPASDIASSGTTNVTVFNPTPGGGTSSAQSFLIGASGGSFIDNFNRANNATIGNNWTEKYPAAFSISNNEVVNIDTAPVDYHDAVVYRPQSEDRADVEVGLEFRLLTPGNLTFPQVHARIQRNTIATANTINDYLFFVDGFEPGPGRAIIARQQAVAGQFECYMLAIPFPSQLTTTDRYRLRFRVTGAGPVVLQGFVERFNGTAWDAFASGSVVHSTSGQTPARDPNLYCDSGSLPAPLTTAGAVGFAKWTTANEVIDNFSWTDLNNGNNPEPITMSSSPAGATSGGTAFTLQVTGANFVPGSIVRWNGSNRTTTYVSSTQVNASITAADIASAGTANVTVFNPTPGGGTSSALSFVISSPAAATVNFDSPTPSGTPGSFLNGTFQGINFGSSQWRWDTPYGPNPTNHIYFGSGTGTSRTFSFASPRTLDSVTVYTVTSGTLTLSDNQGQVRTQTVNPASLLTVATGWSLASTTVTVNFTAGWDLGLDNIVHR